MASGYPDYEGQKQALYLKPEWAAKEGVDKHFSISKVNGAFGAFDTLSYVVPAGKTLVITDYCFSAQAGVVGDADLLQHAVILILDNTSGTQFVRQGGDSGGGQPLSKPIIFPESHELNLLIWCYGNHNITARADCQGYEI